MVSQKQFDYIAREAKVVAPNYSPIPVVLERGKDVWLYDIEGNEYLDMMSAYSAVSHGHCHPELVAELTRQAGELAVCSRAYHTKALTLFLEELCKVTHMDLALPMNTGAEAVETAIKTARRWGYEVKGIPENKAEIIMARGNFHGRTTTIISFSSEAAYKKNFGPLTPGFIDIPFGDAGALEKAITPNTCAVLIEPMQGEAGIIIPEEGWLKKMSEICKANNVLFIVDEVQTGLARTGAMLACEHEGVQPDGLILGKALGGGLLPVSAFLARKEVLNVMTPGSHGSTFGGNPLAAAIGKKALEIMVRDKYAERSKELGKYLMAQLKALKNPAIQDIRGKGLWIGVEIKTSVATARKVAEELARVGILTKDTHDTVIRLAPPLTIEKRELDLAVQKLDEVLTKLFHEGRGRSSVG